MTVTTSIVKEKRPTEGQVILARRVKRSVEKGITVLYDMYETVEVTEKGEKVPREIWIGSRRTLGQCAEFMEVNPLDLMESL